MNEFTKCTEFEYLYVPHDDRHNTRPNDLQVKHELIENGPFSKYSAKGEMLIAGTYI